MNTTYMSHMSIFSVILHAVHLHNYRQYNNYADLFECKGQCSSPVQSTDYRQLVWLAIGSQIFG